MPSMETGTASTGSGTWPRPGARSGRQAQGCHGRTMPGPAVPARLSHRGRDPGVPHGPHLLAGERRVGHAATDALDVQARRLARVQAGQDDAVAIVIDERQREGLRAAGVLEGVEAHEADMREGHACGADRARGQLRTAALRRAAVDLASTTSRR